MNKRFCFYILAKYVRIKTKYLLILNKYYKETKIEYQKLVKILELFGKWENHRTNYKTKFLTSLIDEEKYYQLFQIEKYLLITDNSYPKMLKEIYDPPAIIYYAGNIDLLQTNCLAFVGSRHANKQAVKLLDHLLPELVENNFTIVSGLAKGIDAFSHQRTIYHHGKTIAVIGNGIDIKYPKENFRLQDVIAKEHLLISEYPAGTLPRKYHFPLRNRIIAGLSLGVCVLQASHKSGTAITAKLALEYNRDVFAIPGSPLDSNYSGCLELIKQGAKLTSSAKDIIDELAFNRLYK